MPVSARCARPTSAVVRRRGRADRRVFVLSDGPVEVGGACPVTLTGSGGLAVQIRRFFAGLGPGRPQSQAEVTVTLREHVIGAAAE